MDNDISNNTSNNISNNMSNNIFFDISQNMNRIPNIYNTLKIKGDKIDERQ